MTVAPPARKAGVLVVGGMSHDMDFARLQLLQLLARHDQLRMTVVADFEALEAISRSDFVIAYTCNVQPSAAAERALQDMAESGGRMLGLHATNSLLDFTSDGVAPRLEAALFMSILGSQFIAHPPIGRFRVDIADPDHPLTAGMSGFETVDELYLSEMRAPARVLLSTRFTGETPGFSRTAWPEDAARPVLYLRTLGKGEVAYFNLGHARGHYDAPHRTPFWPNVERAAWETPQFQVILERCVRWVARVGAEMQ
jgi:uncharacterized protein